MLRRVHSIRPCTEWRPRLDRSRMGAIRKGAKGKVVFPDEGGPQAVGDGAGELEAIGGRDP